MQSWANSGIVGILFQSAEECMKEKLPHVVLNLKRTEILDRLLTKNPTKNQTKPKPSHKNVAEKSHKYTE